MVSIEIFKHKKFSETGNIIGGTTNSNLKVTGGYTDNAECGDFSSTWSYTDDNGCNVTNTYYNEYECEPKHLN